MSILFFIILLLLLFGCLFLGLYGFSAPLAQALLIFLYVVFGGDHLGWNTFFIVLLSALAAEGVEFFSGFKGAAKGGGSRRSTWGAIAGGFVGALLGSPFFPMGPILGTFLGTYTGCIALELTASKNLGKAHKVSVLATVSRVAGFAFKTAVSFAIVFGAGLVGIAHLFK